MRRAKGGDVAWLAWDLVVVAAFVVIGRHSHHHGESASGVAHTAWPFVVGLAAGWGINLRRRRRPRTLRFGAVTVVVTVAVGMVLRVVSGQGAAVAFVAVALGFLGLGMVGARLLARRGRRWP